MFSESKLAGPGYIILNVIRVLNVISLALVVVASWVMLVMTVKTSNVHLVFLNSTFKEMVANAIIVLFLRRSFPLHHKHNRSFPHLLRSQPLQDILRPKLAFAQPRIWLRLPWHVNDRSRIQYPWQSQQGCYEPVESGFAYVAHCHCVRHSVFVDGTFQYDCSKYSKSPHDRASLTNL
jgi:hypothetical protein